MAPRPRYIVKARHSEQFTEQWAVATALEVAILTHRWAELGEGMPELTVTFIAAYRGRNYAKVIS